MIIESNVIRYPYASATRLTTTISGSIENATPYEEPRAEDVSVETPNLSEYLGLLFLTLRSATEGLDYFSKVPTGDKGSGKTVDLSGSFFHASQSAVIRYPHLDGLTDEEIQFCIQFLCAERETQASSFDQVIDEHKDTTLVDYSPLSVIIVADTLGRDNFSKLFLKVLENDGKDSKLAWSVLTKCFDDIELEEQRIHFLMQRYRFSVMWSPPE